MSLRGALWVFFHQAAFLSSKPLAALECIRVGIAATKTLIQYVWLLAAAAAEDVILIALRGFLII